MIDSHCHIDLSAFDDDREHVIKNANKLGVQRILVPGLDLAQSKALQRLKESFPCLDLCAGFHPYFLARQAERDYARLKQAWPQQIQALSHWCEANKNKLVAIGEFGLDGTLTLDMDFQKRVFIEQLELATSLKLPVVLHHRKSHNEVIRLLKEQKFSQGGVIHAFSGSEAIAQTYLDLGFNLGVGGTITYPRGAKTRRALRGIPLESLLLETDAPDMPVCGYQGQRNTPERLPLVAQALAELKSCELSHVSEVTDNTYHRLFLN